MAQTVTTREMFIPHPSLAVVKFWQGLVEVVLRVFAIIVTACAFIAVIALVSDLGSPETLISTIEDLRRNTRPPSGWIALVTILVLPFEALVLLVRFLNFQFISNYSTVVFLVDAIINGVIAVFFFGGAVALGVHSGDWRFWLSQGNDEEIRATRINHIAASAAAASTFSFFATFAFIILTVWMVLFVVFKWHQNMARYSPQLERVAKTGDDTSPVAPPKSPSHSPDNGQPMEKANGNTEGEEA